MLTRKQEKRLEKAAKDREKQIKSMTEEQWIAAGPECGNCRAARRDEWRRVHSVKDGGK